MGDPYRFAKSSDDTGPHRDGTPKSPGRSTARVLLWVLLLLCVVGNGVTSFGGFHPLISSVFGLAAIACVVLLVVHHLRHRR